jgi:branched-chain amino acid transport system ATP-binding protein
MLDGPLLRIEGLSKHFGGVPAVAEVSLDIARGEIHAIIGPNGAGKTTFLNLLSGELTPSFGQVWFKGRNVTGWTPDALARAGLGRSFQHSSVMENFTLFENVRLAAQSRSGASFRMFKSADQLADVTKAARAAIEACGIVQPERLAGEVSHGERRQLEAAMLLAAGAEVMLLDEPASGMSRAETLELVAVLQRLRGGRTILLVEHDMDAVFALADRITVLVYGKVLATGAPFEVRENPEVRAAYLGERR